MHVTSKSRKCIGIVDLKQLGRCIQTFEQYLYQYTENSISSKKPILSIVLGIFMYILGTIFWHDFAHKKNIILSNPYGLGENIVTQMH